MAIIPAPGQGVQLSISLERGVEQRGMRNCEPTSPALYAEILKRARERVGKQLKKITFARLEALVKEQSETVRNDVHITGLGRTPVLSPMVMSVRLPNVASPIAWTRLSLALPLFGEHGNEDVVARAVLAMMPASGLVHGGGRLLELRLELPTVARIDFQFPGDGRGYVYVLSSEADIKREDLSKKGIPAQVSLTARA